MLIYCKALGDNEFCLEVFEAGIIETELALQSAIGDTATVAEQLNDLIDDLVKVHASPSPGFSLEGMSQCCGSAYQNRDLISIKRMSPMMRLGMVRCAVAGLYVHSRAPSMLS